MGGHDRLTVDVEGVLDEREVRRARSGMVSKGHYVEEEPPEQESVFEVQPDKGFHSVEKVVVGGDGRERLSISGWFHHIQEGEERYYPEKPAEAKSFTRAADIHLDATPTPQKRRSLRASLNPRPPSFPEPVYLKQHTMKALAPRFVEESSLELHHRNRQIPRDAPARPGRPRRQGPATLQRGRSQRRPQGPQRVGHPRAAAQVALPHFEGRGEERGRGATATPSVDANARSLQDELFSSVQQRGVPCVAVACDEADSDAASRGGAAV
ncbi:hypothetical protein D9611_008313 [Ephemerocybe angulata]|uniref:Uncharacterized protein n=1 Tax=Ephemerocybe angulata TaxID=980116 RepID=A0A8H5BIH9_9AGAR|nr:hypothetical protein D9611_008313 [Tulosesus angulatus]